MKFVYVLPGWEGSASDSRVLRNALEREDCFEVPIGKNFSKCPLLIRHKYFRASNIQVNNVGKYYLVDAGYTNGPGYLAPYRSTRYHLQEWATQGNNPTTYKELFNLRHSKKRNVIERTFGLLKKRWAILRQASFFNIKQQVQIINACCVLHNFLVDKRLLTDARLLEEVDADILTAHNTGASFEYADTAEPIKATNEWTTFRDNLALTMFNEYQDRITNIPTP
ncbi:hypothetical protein KSP39_PZI005248 [Platanthera zijinensis]|uniref:DDE Tnp4 domain-containing protein n=1 Tax=Platanthera zijinensis TaxID=2320716 RepID=A0AAP0BRD9_9ASPA